MGFAPCRRPPFVGVRMVFGRSCGVFECVWELLVGSMLGPFWFSWGVCCAILIPLGYPWGPAAD